MLTLRLINGERRNATIRTESADLLAIRTAARNAIADLDAIQADTSITNAEATAYIKQLALIQERVIRFIAGQVT